MAVDPLRDIDGRVERVMEAYDVPGLAIAVVSDGEVALARGYGVLERGKAGAIDENTVFAIASNTKAFVATTLAWLAHEGELSLDDRVVDRLQGFRAWDPYTTKEMRLRDLVSHRSGLDTWAGDLMWIGAKIDTATLLSRLPELEPKGGLRSGYGYSNLMFVVAGEVIRSVTGKPWDTVVRERLLQPLGMQRTSTTVRALAEQDNVATPHAETDDGQRIVAYLDLDAAGAAGSLNSSVADMALWLRVQLDEGRLGDREIVPAEVIAQTRVPHTPIPLTPDDTAPVLRHLAAYGLGWFLYDYRGRLVVTHSGGLPGMTSRVAMVPEEGIGVVVLTNSESPASSLLAYDVLDGYLGGPEVDHLARAQERAAKKEAEKGEAEEEPVEAGNPALESRAYRGTYRNPLLGRAEVVDDDGALGLRLPDHGGLDCPLSPVQKNVFRCRWSDPIFGHSDVTFDVERKRAVGLRFQVRPGFIDPLEYRFER